MPACRENHPFVCSTIKSPDNVPFEFAIENGASIRIVFLNYQSQKHKHKRSRSRQHVFTALLDNARVNRGAATRIEACLVSGNCRTSVTTSVQRFVIQRPTGLRLKFTSLQWQSRAQACLHLPRQHVARHWSEECEQECNQHHNRNRSRPAK